MQEKLNSICTLAIFVLCYLPTQSTLAQSEMADEAVAIEEAWDAEQEVLEKFTELGGWYKTGECLSEEMKDMVDPDKQIFVVEVNMVYTEEGGRQDNDNFSADALQHIAKCTQVRKIFLKETQANDEQLALIAHLKHVETFFVWDAHDLTDEGMKHLGGFKKLKNLHVSESLITDEGIGCLTGLADIESLSLQGNGFTDDIFLHAAKFDKLKTLRVGTGSTKFSDDGIMQLYECKNLKTLGIQRCDITSGAVSALRKELPGLENLHHSNR